MDNLNSPPEKQEIPFHEYAPCVISVAFSILFVSVLRLLDSESFQMMILYFSSGTYLLCDFSMDSSEKAYAPTRMYFSIMFIWLFHGALFHHQETHIIPEDLMIYFAILSSIVGVLGMFDLVVDNMIKALIFAFMMMIVNIIPHGEHNAFYSDAPKIYLRLCIFSVLYWVFVFTNDRSSSVSIEIDATSGQVDAVKRRKLVVLRDAIRVAWVLFVPDAGLLITIFILIIYSGITVFRKTRFYKSISDLPEV